MLIRQIEHVRNDSKWFGINHLLKSNQIKLQKQARLFLRAWPLTTWFRFPRDLSLSTLWSRPNFDRRNLKYEVIKTVHDCKKLLSKISRKYTKEGGLHDRLISIVKNKLFSFQNRTVHLSGTVHLFRPDRVSILVLLKNYCNCSEFQEAPWLKSKPSPEFLASSFNLAFVQCHLIGSFSMFAHVLQKCSRPRRAKVGSMPRLGLVHPF